MEILHINGLICYSCSVQFINIYVTSNLCNEEYEALLALVNCTKKTAYL